MTVSYLDLVNYCDSEILRWWIICLNSYIDRMIKFLVKKRKKILMCNEIFIIISIFFGKKILG